MPRARELNSPRGAWRAPRQIAEDEAVAIGREGSSLRIGALVGNCAELIAFAADESRDRAWHVREA